MERTKRRTRKNLVKTTLKPSLTWQNKIKTEQEALIPVPSPVDVDPPKK
jgi:hypothetical protein